MGGEVKQGSAGRNLFFFFGELRRKNALMKLEAWDDVMYMLLQ
jgi:hypothetical protein